MGMHRISAIEARPGGGATAYSFIVLQFVVAKGEVVHGALTAGQLTQSSKKTVDNIL